MNINTTLRIMSSLEKIYNNDKIPEKDYTRLSMLKNERKSFQIAVEGTAHHSIRSKVFYDALQDMAALNSLEKLYDKQLCLDIIEEYGQHSITFSDYPHSDDWMLSTREKINARIKEYVK